MFNISWRKKSSKRKLSLKKKDKLLKAKISKKAASIGSRSRRSLKTAT